MIRRTAAVALATALGLVFALPTAAAPIAVAVVAVQQDPITEADVEAKAEVFGAAMETLAAELGGIRADASLSDADKNARMDAAIAVQQPKIDEFVDFLALFIRQEAISEGQTAEEADAAVEMVRNMFATQLIAALKSGDLSGMGG